jgi:hypothetical protein
LGITLIDFFTGTPFVVELEKDLSIKQQFLDVVIIRKQVGPLQSEPPDGLDNLAEYNLLSYKSIQQAFDEWTVDELIGYYVNYRKQVSPSLNRLLPPEMFRLYGVSTRFPQKLADVVPLEPVRVGVYQIQWGTHQIRVMVLSEIPEAAHNTIWNLFSTVPEKVTYGASQFRGRATGMSSIINRLFQNYQLEGLIMPYTMEDYQRETAREYLHTLSVEEILQQLSVDERLHGLSADEILQRLSVDEIRQVSPDERRRLRQLLEAVDDE